MPSRAPSETIPVEAFLDGLPAPHRQLAERLRSIVLDAEPDAIERVRPGWRLIGYDLPARRHGAFFAWVWPEPEHVHLGFPNGVFIDDARRVLQGAGITKRARWLTYARGGEIDEAIAADLVRAAAVLARIPGATRG